MPATAATRAGPRLAEVPECPERRDRIVERIALSGDGVVGARHLGRDERAASGDAPHETICGNTVERRADGHPAHPELLAERALGGKWSTRREPRDTVTQNLLDRGGAGGTGGRRHGG